MEASQNDNPHLVGGTDGFGFVYLWVIFSQASRPTSQPLEDLDLDSESGDRSHGLGRVLQAECGRKMEKDIEVLKWQHFIEYGLIYVWILKDYAWSSNSYYMGAIFGTTAVVWAIALATFSFYRGDHEDLFMNCIMTIWLSGNYVWMSGELTLTNSDNGIPFWGNNSQNTQVALDCFITALSLLSLYYLVLKPLEVFTLDPVSVELERQEGLAARFPSYFKTLRQASDVM